MKPSHFRFELKTIRRGDGSSMVAKAAYISGAWFADYRTGELHDYRSRQKTVVFSGVMTPNGCEWATEPEVLWNEAERAERRHDSRVGREIVVSIPHRLSPEQGWLTLCSFLWFLISSFGWAGQAALHRHGRGDRRNWHGHILLTSRQVTSQGMGKKTREWDRADLSSYWVEFVRRTWAAIINRELVNSKISERVDHRSYKRQGLSLLPGVHDGKELSGLQRRKAQMLKQAAQQIHISGIEQLTRELLRLNGRVVGPHAGIATEYRNLLEECGPLKWRLHAIVADTLRERHTELQSSNSDLDRELAEAVRYVLLLDQVFSRESNAEIESDKDKRKGRELEC